MKKRWTALLLSLVLMLSTAACGNSAGGDASSGAESSAASSSAEAGVADSNPETPEDASTQPADTSGEETPEETEKNENLTKPAEKPVEKPTAKPVETPAASKPAAKPAGGQKPPSSAVSSGSSSSADVQVDLAAFYSTLNSKFDLPPSMAALSQEEIDAFYTGLSDLKPVQCVVYMPMISAVACEVALVECASEDDVASVKSIFQSRIDYQVDTGAFYPETIELWETQSGIYSHGKYVMLYCGDNGSQVAAAFQALFDGAK